MTKWFLLLVVIALAVAGWYNRDKISAWISSSKAIVDTAPPPVTPHPATDSKALAVKSYPALGMKDSVFNKKFLELYDGLKVTDPAFLAQADWPMQLAERTARELGVSLTALPTPIPAPPPTPISNSVLNQRPGGMPVATVRPAVQLPGFQGSALDQRPPSYSNKLGGTPPPH